ISAENVEGDYYSRVRSRLDDRNICTFSNHLTVWLDKYTDAPWRNCPLAAVFQRFIQPLNTLSEEEAEFDYPIIDSGFLEKLKHCAYCLKPFSEVDACLAFIRKNRDKKIFFISSGTMGKLIVPQIAGWPQIHGIYIFCGSIKQHAQCWAMDYVEYISAMLDHQDDLLLRTTIDISKYLEDCGDDHMILLEPFKAKYCYAWGIKLSLRQEKLGGKYYREQRARLMGKLDEAETTGQKD
ncbi:unnamed protein product, partial [Didymodactylos carnosus]